LDGHFIQTWEVVDAMFPNGGENKEKFRFMLCAGREVGHSPLDEVTTMDLSHNRLEWLDPDYLKSLINLTSINLADNFLKDAAVMEGELHHLKVKALDLSNNMVVMFRNRGFVCIFCPRIASEILIFRLLR
jgi:hypothetical protein